MKTLLIDPTTRTVTVIDLPYVNLKEMYEAMGPNVTTIAIPLIFANRDQLVVDDEALLGAPKAYFLLKEYPRPIAGRALIIGNDDHGATPAVTDPDDLSILWMNSRDIDLYLECEQKQVDRMRDDPAYADHIFITMKEVLKK